MVRALFTTDQITEINLASGLDSVARPTSLKRHITASSTRAEIPAICSRLGFCRLVDEADSMGRILEDGRSFEIGRTATASKLFSSCALEGGVATSCNAAFKNWAAHGGIPAACAPLVAGAIWRPSRRIGSGLIIAVMSSSHSGRGVVVAEFCLMKS